MAAELGDAERAIALLPVSSPIDVAQAFDWFVGEGDLNTVERFLEYGVSVDSLDSGVSMLSRAAGHGQVEMVRFLIERGASLQGVPLVAAMHRPSVEMAKVLLDAGANPNQGYPRFPLRSPPWLSEKT